VQVRLEGNPDVVVPLAQLPVNGQDRLGTLTAFHVEDDFGARFEGSAGERPRILVRELPVDGHAEMREIR